MYKEKTVAVVVPAYNEEGFVGEVLDTIPTFVDRVYPVDDNSTDGTWEEILAHSTNPNGTEERTLANVQGGGLGQQAVENVEDSVSAEGPNDRTEIVPIRHETNRGVGGAIKTGYRRALKDNVDVVAVMAGDGQMDPDMLASLINPVIEGEADYAKGNRLLNREYRQDMPTFRLAGNAILTFLTKIASGYWKMMDPQNGYTAISTTALDNIAVQEMYEYYGYCNDLLVKLNAKGMQIADVGIPAVYGDEESNIRYPAYILSVSLMLLRNFFWRLKVRYFVLDFHPLGFFYLFGIGTGFLGIIGGFWSIYMKFVLDELLFVRISISLLIFITGSMFFMFAMLFDMQANEDREIHV